MKKKTIEKLPFLTLTEVHRGKTVKYVAVTDVREISGEPHLFIEVYRNRRDSRGTPVVRIVLTKRDFGNFFPDTGTWTRQKITYNTWSSYGLVWRDGEDRRKLPYKSLKKENIMHSAADEKRLRGFLKNRQETEGDAWAWWDCVKYRQDGITAEESNARNRRRRERRTAALEERIKKRWSGHILQEM